MRQAALERDPRTHPLLREALPYVGHFVTRNRGTVGGSVAHADGVGRDPALPRGARRHDRRRRARRAPGDRARRLLRHALPDDARAGRARRRDASGRSRPRTRASRSRSSRSAPATTGSRWWPSCCGGSTVSRATSAIRVGAVTDRPTALAEVEQAVDGAPRDGGVGARGGRARRRGRRPAGLDPRLRRATSATSPGRSSSGRCCAPGSGRHDRDHADRQRAGRRRGGRAAAAPDRLPPPPPRAHRHPRRLRARRLRRVHRAARRRRRCARCCLLAVQADGVGGRDGRVARRRRAALAAPGGLQAPPRAPVRLLHARAS